MICNSKRTRRVQSDSQFSASFISTTQILRLKCSRWCARVSIGPACYSTRRTAHWLYPHNLVCSAWTIREISDGTRWKKWEEKKNKIKITTKHVLGYSPYGFMVASPLPSFLLSRYFHFVILRILRVTFCLTVYCALSVLHSYVYPIYTYKIHIYFIHIHLKIPIYVLVYIIQ